MRSLLDAKEVSIYQMDRINGYFKAAPFHPSKEYPEYPFQGHLSAEKNEDYDAVRNAIMLLGLDTVNYGSKQWNPFGEIIRPGDKVVIKPNFVLDRHHDGGTLDCVITQPSVIRAVCDYVYIALQGEGQIVIADAPQANCNFDNLLKNTNIESVSEFYRDVAGKEIPIYDLRQLKLDDFFDVSSRIDNEGDPLGYRIINVGEDSSFIGLQNEERIYGADFDRNITRKHHHGTTHEYCVANTILSADVIVSVPKMKVHRKAGVTLNLKNLIGINGNKNYLPHFRIGTKDDGGDEFAELSAEQKRAFYFDRRMVDLFLASHNRIGEFIYKLYRVLYYGFKKLFQKYDTTQEIKAGDWSGNDTIWRTVLDLNKILLYSNKDGVLEEEPQRRFISVIDGVIGGEKEGPLVPDEKRAGVIACGLNPLITDVATARIMGFAPKEIPKFQSAYKLENRQLSNVRINEITIYSNHDQYIGALQNEDSSFLNFIPAKGWLGRIEV